MGVRVFQAQGLCKYIEAEAENVNSTDVFWNSVGWYSETKLENRVGQGCKEPLIPSSRGLLTISLLPTLLGHLREWFSNFCYHPAITTLSKDLNLPFNSNQILNFMRILMGSQVLYLSFMISLKGVKYATYVCNCVFIF